MQTAYCAFKRKMLSGIETGRFQQNFADNKNEMGKGWRLEHEIVNQFDVGPLLYRGKEPFLASFEASYCHRAQAICCETVAKRERKG